MCDCKKAFLFPEEIKANDKVDHILKNDSGGECENISVSQHSMGAVTNDEVIARAIVFPHMFSKSEPLGLNETIFDDVFNKGGSAQRLIPLGEKEQVNQIHDIQERNAKNRREDTAKPQKDRRYIGLVRLLVSELRSIQLFDLVRNNRVRVYDTASESDVNHVDIVVDNRDLIGEHKAKKKLIKVMLLALSEKRGLEVSPFLEKDFIAIRDIKKYCQEELVYDPVTNAYSSLESIKSAV